MGLSQSSTLAATLIISVLGDSAEYHDSFGWSCKDYARSPISCLENEDAISACPDACHNARKGLEDAYSKYLKPTEANIQPGMNEEVHFQPEASFLPFLPHRRLVPQCNGDAMGLSGVDIKCKIDPELGVPTGKPDDTEFRTRMNILEIEIRMQYDDACDKFCKGIKVGGGGNDCIFETSSAIIISDRPTTVPSPSPTPTSEFPSGTDWWVWLLLSLLLLCCLLGCCLAGMCFYMRMRDNEEECGECDLEPMVGEPIPLGGGGYKGGYDMVPLGGDQYVGNQGGAVAYDQGGAVGYGNSNQQGNTYSNSNQQTNTYAQTSANNNSNQRGNGYVRGDTRGAYSRDTSGAYRRDTSSTNVQGSSDARNVNNYVGNAQPVGNVQSGGNGQSQGTAIRPRTVN